MGFYSGNFVDMHNLVSYLKKVCQRRDLEIFCLPEKLDYVYFVPFLGTIVIAIEFK